MRMLHSLVYILFKRIATSFPGSYCPLSLQEKEKRETLGTRLIGSLPDDLKGHARDATCIIRPVSWSSHWYVYNYSYLLTSSQVRLNCERFARTSLFYVETSLDKSVLIEILNLYVAFQKNDVRYFWLMIVSSSLVNVAYFPILLWDLRLVIS